MRSRRTISWLAVSAAVVAGCGTDHAFPTHPRALPVPQNTSAVGAVERLEWSWNRKDAANYRRLLTSDFRFVDSLDPHAAPWTREDEIAFASDLFANARKIALIGDANLVAQADPRPGKDARWHQLVRTSIDLEIVIDQIDFRNAGATSFYLVRGDSLECPDGPVDCAADSTRWYVERWEDETGSFRTLRRPGLW